MFCPNCGNEIKDGYKFCPKCGKPIYFENGDSQDEVVKETKTIENVTNSIPLDNYVPNPLIIKELDFEGVKKMAEQGNKVAMLRQAFRYEMGIGTEVDNTKAEELYNNVGGKNIILSLEDSHINRVLPAPNYKSTISPLYEDKDGFDGNMKALPFIKDLFLDYSYKIELAKSQNRLSKEDSARYKDDFIRKLKQVRNMHPELLLANIEETFKDDDYNQLFDAIKKSVSNRYSLKWIPSLFNFSDSIDGNVFNIPSIHEIKSNGFFSINYCEDDEKIKLLNQFVFTLLLQLPINKIRINFVDFDGKYEYNDILRQLNSEIYGKKPITTKDQFVDLLNRYEDRRISVIQKYGIYPDYCEQNKEIPICYEFVFLFDSDVDIQLEKNLLRIMNDSYQIGVYFVVFRKVTDLQLKSIISKPCILNSLKNELFSPKELGIRKIIENGIIFHNIKKDVKYLYTIQINKVNHESLDRINSLFKYKDRFRTSYSLPKILHTGMSLEKAEKMQKELETMDADSKVLRLFFDNRLMDLNLSKNKVVDDLYEDISDKDDTEHHNYEEFFVYDVVLIIKNYPIITNYNFDALKDYTESLGVKGYSKNPIYIKGLINKGLILKSFPTLLEANNFMIEQKPPNVTYKIEDRARLIPYFIFHKKVDQICIGLFVPQNCISAYDNFEQDLYAYLTKIGFTSANIKLVISVVMGKKKVDSFNCSRFPSYKSKNNCLCITEESIQYLPEHKAYFFPNIIDKKYVMDFGFWGFLANSDKDLRTANDAISQCQQDILNIEKELDKFAIQEWGNEYGQDHLMFKDIIENAAYLEICKAKRYRVPVLKCNNSSENALVKPIDIVDDKLFLQACVCYINKEAEARETTKVIPLVYDATKIFYDDITNELLIDVGRKGKDEMQFRMDLVSHVHSFIIGQSGSGKSVFLHNVIGGAMLKYAPEDLQLYLLDFKLGGVEFNRYQGSKHVKALLVDNSDPQVTLEILRELHDSMKERGKLLRSAGVINIGEYNKQHQQNKIPHVLVVVDECHEMFKADDSIPRQVRNEISNIVIKIAKEGRSQGVHLVFATQTLSGTEISSEIINNVSDFYLLKCAQTDSERLVPNSSAITSELSTGQIYYHHVDEQVRFQAYYTDKEAAEKLMTAIVEKAKDHRSNGEFYFNGAQMFYLDEAMKEQMMAVKGKSPLAFMGKAIDISQKDLFIKLNEDFSENVLLLGLNDLEQVTRTTMNLFVSLMMSAKLKHKDISFKVIDCINNEEGKVHELIYDLENEGYCEIIERRQRRKFFKELAQRVQNGTAEETILLILGQDRFRELKNDLPLEDGDTDLTSSSDNPMMTINAFLDDDGSSSNDYKDESNIKTFREALNIILDKGPDYGVHTLLQLEKVTNLLFDDYISAKVVFQKFKHLVMLRSDEMTGSRIGLSDDIRLEKLSSDWERLRAYYYAEESDNYMLFTPYMPSKTKDIINLLKTI